MIWVETSNLEKDIILSVHKTPLSITEISKKTKRTKSTISITVKRLIKQDILTKTHDYQLDARKSEISTNHKRVRIQKTHLFYLTYFALAFIPFIILLLLSFILKKYFLLVGCSIGILPSLIFVFYQAYVKEDKVIVEKNPKLIRKEKQKEPEKLLDNTN